MKIKLFKFPIFKTNFFVKHLKFWNKTKPFKCLGVVSHGRKCEVQCTLCKRAYAPKK
jgi:hypothetical protein